MNGGTNWLLQCGQSLIGGCVAPDGAVVGECRGAPVNLHIRSSHGDVTPTKIAGIRRESSAPAEIESERWRAGRLLEHKIPSRRCGRRVLGKRKPEERHVGRKLTAEDR